MGGNGTLCGVGQVRWPDCPAYFGSAYLRPASGSPGHGGEEPALSATDRQMPPLPGDTSTCFVRSATVGAAKWVASGSPAHRLVDPGPALFTLPFIPGSPAPLKSASVGAGVGTTGNHRPNLQRASDDGAFLSNGHHTSATALVRATPAPSITVTPGPLRIANNTALSQHYISNHGALIRQIVRAHSGTLDRLAVSTPPDRDRYHSAS